MKYHDRIFEMFQRLHRQEDFAGTGIGLALVKKAAERMHGRVWAESQPGAGATFWLELPLAQADANANAQAQAQAQAQAPTADFLPPPQV
jgi:signal transduction histidine kinase